MTLIDDQSSAAPVRLAILEKDPLLRAGIRSMMQPYQQITVVGDFELVRGPGVADSRPDVLLVGADLLDERLRTALPGIGRGQALPVVTVMEPGDQSTMRNAVMCSVRGFVDRNDSYEDLGTAVREVHSGRTFLSPSIAESLIGWVTSRMHDLPMSSPGIEQVLTDRELEILQLLGEGLTNTKIARRLDIQEGTVRSHTYRILTKLKLRTRTEAVLIGHTYANSRRLPPLYPA